MTDAAEEPTIDQQKPTWGLAEVVLGFVAVTMMSVIFLSAYRYFTHWETGDPLSLGEVLTSFIAGWLGFAGTAWLVSGRTLAGMQEQVGFKFILPIDIYKGLAVGLLSQLLVTIIYLPLTLTDSKAGESISDPAAKLTEVASGWHWIPFAIGVAVISPICEELFFRGVTLRAMARKWGTWAGIFGSGVFFGFAHFEGIQTPALIMFGWILAWRATRTGRIGETIIAHGTFNAFTLVTLALTH